MPFTYTVCHPDRKDIEKKNSPISGKHVIEIAKNYPWKQQLLFSESLNEDDFQYSPSLDFTSIEDAHSFGLTAHPDGRGSIEFSLWYKRPKNIKIFFWNLRFNKENDN